MRKKNPKKSKKNPKKSKKNKKSRINKKKGNRKSYKIMKGGSLAGNFFRFLAGENDKDKLQLSELKELDEYKKQKKKENKTEFIKNVNENINRTERMQNEKSNNYKDNHKIIDSIADLDEGVSEDKNIDVLSQSGGGLLDSINETENANFDKWFTGSTNSYKEVVDRYDKGGAETVTNDQWNRQIVNGTPFHQSTKPLVAAGSSDTAGTAAGSEDKIIGGRRLTKKRRTKKRRTKKRRRKKSRTKKQSRRK